LRPEKDTFFMGEHIRVTLDFRNTSETLYPLDTSSYDRSGRLEDPQFHVDGPEGGFADPLAVYFATYAGIMGGLSSAKTLGQHSLSYDLNEWVRFDLPGTYRVYCTSSRVGVPGSAHESFRLCSQVITFKIAKSDDAWVADQVRSALDMLKSTDVKERRQGARVLRFLAEPQAMGPLALLLGDADLRGEAFFGLVGTRDPSGAKAALLEGFRQPDTVITDSYLRALATVSAWPQGPIISYDSSNIEVIHRQYDRLQAAQKAASKEVLGELSAALPFKRGRAQATACVALLRQGLDSPELSDRLAGVFTQLTEAEQCAVLEYQWNQVRCPAFQGTLEQILNQPWTCHQWYSGDVQSWAAYRYLEMQPEKARNLIMEDMRRARPLLSGRALMFLPDDLLPQLDDVFVAHIASGEYDHEKLLPLIERYASKRVLADVIAFYQKHEGRWTCEAQKQLLGYWIKHDPEAGLAALKRAAMLRKDTGCFRTVLGDILPRHYSPAAEAMALSFLGDSDNDVVWNVVELLERHGSAAIADPLLAHLANMGPGDNAVPPNNPYARPSALVRKAIISCLFRRRDWQLSEGQKKALCGLLNDDADRAMFYRRFPEMMEMLTP